MASRKKRTKETLDLLLIFGVKKIPAHLDLLAFEPGPKCLNLGHLATVVHRETSIEPESQKLIYRGRTLFRPEDVDTVVMNSGLASLGLRNGDRVMVLGRKTATDTANDAVVFDADLSAPSGKSRPQHHQPPPQERERVNLNSLPKQQQDVNPLTDLTRQFDTICDRCKEHIAAIPDAKDVKSLKTRKTGLMLTHENLMKLLEKIDSTPPRDDEDFRKQRKALVNSIQSSLDKCEDSLDSVKQKIRTVEQTEQQPS